MRRRAEDQRTGLEHMRKRARIVPRVGPDLSESNIPRVVDELAKRAVRDRRSVDPKSVDGNAMRRRFFGVMFVRAHAECPAGNEDHVGNIWLCLLARFLTRRHDTAPALGVTHSRRIVPRVPRWYQATWRESGKRWRNSSCFTPV